jgi:SEC-C motif-containing protein
VSASPPAVCPCRAPGDALPYEACCGRYHAGPLLGLAPSAEALMRSRYSAFVQGRIDYLLATWHASTRPLQLETEPAGLKWLGLELRRRTVIDADHATVEFVARCKLGGRAERLHEISRFVRDGGRWFYVDADLC